MCHVPNMQYCRFMVILCKHKTTRLELEHLSLCVEAITEPDNACGDVICAALTGKVEAGATTGRAVITINDKHLATTREMQVTPCLLKCKKKKAHDSGIHFVSCLIFYTCLSRKSTGRFKFFPVTQGVKLCPLGTYH